MLDFRFDVTYSLEGECFEGSFMIVKFWDKLNSHVWLVSLDSDRLSDCIVIMTAKGYIKIPI